MDCAVCKLVVFLLLFSSILVASQKAPDSIKGFYHRDIPPCIQQLPIAQQSLGANPKLCIKPHLSFFPSSILESSASCGLCIVNSSGQIGTGQQEPPTLLVIDFDALLGKLRTRCCTAVAS